MFKKKAIRDYLYGRRKYFFYAAVFLLVFSVLFQYISSRWGFFITLEGQQCFLYKYWIVEKNKRPDIGDYVAFKGHGIPHFPEEITWVKRIVGDQGYRISAKKLEAPERYSDWVYVNGLPKQLEVQGYVYLFDAHEHMITGFDVFERDTKGRPLPIADSQVIPKGKYFVMATDKRSFDSRYWGLIDESWIIGKAHPVY